MAVAGGVDCNTGCSVVDCDSCCVFIGCGGVFSGGAVDWLQY